MPSRRQRAYLARPEPIRITTLQARTVTPAEQKRAERGRGTVAGYVQPRNGLPEAPLYAWRSRTYPWAQRALALAEAEHGTPPSEAR